MSKIGALTGLLMIGVMLTTPALAHYRSHSYYRSYRPYPAACEAVIYPRSPPCAGRPAHWDPWYTPPLYNLFMYY
jgi:hypothetical protein